MKNIFLLILSISVFFTSCKKEKSTPLNLNYSFIITTPGFNFSPSQINCNIGDTIYFDLGPTHNAMEVSEDNYNSGSASLIINGFYFDFGTTGFFIPTESKTYYYVCAPHLPNMKGSIIVE